MDSNVTQLCSTRGARIGFVSVLGMLTLFLLVQTIAGLANIGRAESPATDTITVQGTGQATLAPDVARISFTIVHKANSVAEAQEETTKKSNAVLEFIKKQAIDSKDIKTLSYSISPVYSSTPRYCNPFSGECPEQKITGYQVSETIQVTVRNLELVGSLFSGLGEFGVENVNGPSFALDDETDGYNLARADAIQKAKEQAKDLEYRLGVRLGKIVNFSESNGGYYPMYAYGKGGGVAESRDYSAPSPSIQPGENTYSASVSITYEIR